MKGEKYMKSIKHYDDFTDVLNRMNNDDFALFLTGYAESIGRNIQFQFTLISLIVLHGLAILQKMVGLMGMMKTDLLSVKF